VAWVYLVLLLFLMGLLQALLPEGWPAPDLFLVYALWLAASRPPALGLALAFLVGLLQDLLGFGLLGLHATGLLLAAYAYYGAARHLDLSSGAGALAAFALAFLGKWFGYFLVAYWLRLDLPALPPWLPLGEGLLSLAFFWPLRPKGREEPKA